MGDQDELPPSMRNEINHHLYGDLLQQMPLLAGLGKDVLYAACTAAHRTWPHPQQQPHWLHACTLRD